METRGPSIVLKTHKSLLARDTRLLADGIVDVRTMRGEHFAIYLFAFSIRHRFQFLYLRFFSRALIDIILS